MGQLNKNPIYLCVCILIYLLDDKRGRIQILRAGMHVIESNSNNTAPNVIAHCVFI